MKGGLASPLRRSQPEATGQDHADENKEQEKGDRSKKGPGGGIDFIEPIADAAHTLTNRPKIRGLFRRRMLSKVGATSIPNKRKK